jgi:hypothetical protein
MRVLSFALLLGIAAGCQKHQVVVTIDREGDAASMTDVVIDTSMMPSPTRKTDGITLEKRPGMDRVIVKGKTPTRVRVIVEPLIDSRGPAEVVPQPRPPATSATTQPVMPGRRTEP